MENTNIDEYENTYNLELPRRSSYVYRYIEHINDYEYTNSLAYEMVRRNEEFKELTKYNGTERSIEHVHKILQLGLDPKIIYFPKVPMELLDVHKAQKKDEKFFHEPMNSHLINDIHNGLNQLIQYYYNQNKIFTLIDKDNKQDMKSYIKVNDITFDEILETSDKYYIPVVIKNDFITTDLQQMYQISNDIPLKILDTDFLNTFTLLDTKYKYTKLVPFYSSPELSFPQSNIVTIPINLNLEYEEIIAYVSKAKEEYNKQSLTIQHPLELIGNVYEKSKKSKSEKELPKEIQKRKKAIADAFYVYDLFKILKPYFNEKRIKLKNKRDQKIEEIKNLYKNSRNTQNKKNDHIRELKNTYKDEINQYSNSQLQNIISDISNISVHKVERYNKYMKEYIDDKKYKELITGKIFT